MQNIFKMKTRWSRNNNTVNFLNIMTIKKYHKITIYNLKMLIFSKQRLTYLEIMSWCVKIIASCLKLIYEFQNIHFCQSNDWLAQTQSNFLKIMTQYFKNNKTSSE